MSRELTHEEIRAVNALKRLAKTWPESLWLYSASGSLHVMQKNDEGKKAHDPLISDSFDSAAVIATIAIENDGGDW